MRILTEKLDTRGGHYHGRMIGKATADLVERAKAGGYDAAELTWWDVAEGWVTHRVTWQPLKAAAQ